MNDEEKVTSPPWIKPQTAPTSDPPKAKRTRRTRAQIDAESALAMTVAAAKPRTISTIPPPLSTPQGLSVRPFFRWFDLWIGLYIDTANRAVYFCPLPMIGLRITY